MSIELAVVAFFVVLRALDWTPWVWLSNVPRLNLGLRFSYSDCILQQQQQQLSVDSRKKQWYVPVICQSSCGKRYQCTVQTGEYAHHFSPQASKLSSTHDQEQALWLDAEYDAKDKW